MIFEHATPAAPTPFDHLDLAHLLADDLERVYQGGEHDDGGAMLIVVKDRNIEFFFQSLFESENNAARRCLRD